MAWRWLVFALIVGCGSSTPGPAPHPLPPSMQSSPAPVSRRLSSSPRALPEIDDMLSRVSQARELASKGPVVTHVLTHHELVERMLEVTERDTPAEKIAEQGRALALLDLGVDAESFGKCILETLTSQVQGFYDPRSKALYLPDDLPADAQQEVLAHELSHAIQDQHFDLDRMMASRLEEGDALAAAHALVEGDATATSLTTLMGKSNPDLVQHLEEAVRTALLMRPHPECPGFITRSLLMAYASGFAFVERLRSQGGWQAVNEALMHPPDSTEQLLHWDKWIARELPALRPSANESADESAVGELDLRALLMDWLPENDAIGAAAGWNGDTMKMSDGPDGPTCEWEIAFDRESDVVEMQKALSKHWKTPCHQRADGGRTSFTRRAKSILVVGTERGKCPATSG